MKAKHIFFDLDRTLWDFETNSYETLKDLCKRFNLVDYGVINYDNFINKYKVHNEKLWTLYRDEKISKLELRTKRFSLALSDYNIKNEALAKDFGDAYVIESPLKTKLFPFAEEILKYLETKYYLHIITNGFDEVQHIKLDASKISHFFKEIITSEQVGYKKPNSKIFQYALNKVNAKKTESVMIGDDLPVDILGARDFGINQIFFNPNQLSHNENIDVEITCLSQLKDIF